MIVTKSTVPVGTSRKVRSWVQEELDARESKATFSVASNPEFLREGAAISDFQRPDRVVIGVDEGTSRPWRSSGTSTGRSSSTRPPS